MSDNTLVVVALNACFHLDADKKQVCTKKDEIVRLPHKEAAGLINQGGMRRASPSEVQALETREQLAKFRGSAPPVPAE